MQHTDFSAWIRAVKTAEYKELQAAVELHGGIYEWDLRNPEHPVIAVNLDGIIPAPADVRIYKIYIRKGIAVPSPKHRFWNETYPNWTVIF